MDRQTDDMFSTEDLERYSLAYLKGGLESVERAEFEELLTRSQKARAELERQRALLDALEASSERWAIERVRSQVRQALERRASDIHIVPGAREVSAQLRVDGVLHEVDRYPKKEHSAVVDRWKAMADVSVTERRLPQDGRAMVQENGREYDFRVSFSPGVSGEHVVARILDRSGVFMGLDRLGLAPEQRDAIARLMERPNGLILVTGPSGSGRTTLLYSMLQTLLTPGQELRAIMTAEDPVEVLLEGTTQVHVRRQEGLTFAVALRAFLRQDPDVIMAGEIRDQETAEMIAAAATTGHLALSALYAADSAKAITRLTDIGMAPFLVANILNGIIATRLARKMCQACRTPFEPDPVSLGMLGLTPTDGPFYRGTGCEACRGTGYLGRTGLFEVLEVDTVLRQAFTHSDDMERLAREHLDRGGHSMRAHGRWKVLEGITTVEEVVRILPG